MYLYCSRTCGLPHSSYSPTVSGSDASSIVLSTSTNGTWEHRGAEQIRSQVDHRAQQQAARAAALDHEALGSRVASRRQVLGAGDEVGERVRLVQHPPLVVPGLAHLAAAAHVRDRDDDAAIEEAEARFEENVRRHRDAVGAVAVEQQRAGRARHVLAQHQRDRNPGAVGGRRVEPLGRGSAKGRSRPGPRSASSAPRAAPPCRSRTPRRGVVNDW